MSAGYVLMTDTTCDLPASYLEEHQVVSIPLYYTIGGKTYAEGTPGALTYKEFYVKIRAGETATTSMINMQAHMEAFEVLCKQGLDVFYIPISTGISGTCEAAEAAAKELRERYPECKIYVIRSLCASLGHGLVVHYAVNKRDEGVDIDTLYDYVDGVQKTVIHLFTVDDLMHLHRGGRVSRAQAIMGSVIGVKPMLDVDSEGRPQARKKIRGRKQALTGLVNWMEEFVDGKDLGDIAISHGDCLEDAQFVERLIRERYKVGQCIINPIGPVIGTHSGPGTVALFFRGKKRVE